MYTSFWISLLVAFLFAIILSYAFKRSGPGPIGGLVFIFIIIFMFSWAIGAWIEPIRPTQIQYPWISYFFIGFFIMLLLAALLPSSTSDRRKISSTNSKEAVKADEVVGITFGVFFWILLISLIVIGIIRWV